MFGKLSWSAIPFDQPIPMAASLFMTVLIFAILALVTWKGWWPYLWREWLTSVDHKRIGVMYVILALVLLLRGFIDALMMRSQLAIAAGGRARVPAARALRSDLLGARHDHDLLHGHAVRWWGS